MPQTRIPTVHFFATESSGEVYDNTQTGYFVEGDPRLEFDPFAVNSDESSAIYDACLIEPNDGDILIVAKEGIYGILVNAWPTVVYSDAKDHEFHAIDPMYASWQTLDGGKYWAAAQEARRLFDAR